MELYSLLIKNNWVRKEVIYSVSHGWDTVILFCLLGFLQITELTTVCELYVLSTLSVYVGRDNQTRVVQETGVVVSEQRQYYYILRPRTYFDLR